MKTFPAVTAPSAAKHTAASQIDLTIFQSRRPLLQGNLRFYWGGYAAEYLSIMAIHRKFGQAADDAQSTTTEAAFGMRASENPFGWLPSRIPGFPEVMLIGINQDRALWLLARSRNSLKVMQRCKASFGFGTLGPYDPVVAHESSAPPEIPRPQICT
jgi:hypothetical protein